MKKYKKVQEGLHIKKYIYKYWNIDISDEFNNSFSEL